MNDFKTGYNLAMSQIFDMELDPNSWNGTDFNYTKSLSSGQTAYIYDVDPKSFMKEMYPQNGTYEAEV